MDEKFFNLYQEAVLIQSLLNALWDEVLKGYLHL